MTSKKNDPPEAESEDSADLDEIIDGISEPGPLPADVELLQIEVRQLRSKLRTLGGLGDLVVRAVEEAYTPPPKPTALRVRGVPKGSKADAEVAILHLSDMQLGKITDDYSMAVAAERIYAVVEKAVKITKRRRVTAPINEIRVYITGDMVEGEEIFPHQAHEIEASLIFQACRLGPEILTTAVMTLLEHFETVKVCCVAGNHGRVSKGAAKETNWDNVLYYCTKALLRNEDRLEFVISEREWLHDEVLGWGMFLIHGHQIKGGFAGYPWYGAGKRTQGWGDIIPYADEGGEVDYVWCGHFHTLAAAVVNYRMFLANGTVESRNEHAAANMAAAGHPVQRLVFVTERIGIINDHWLYPIGRRLSQAALRRLQS